MRKTGLKIIRGGYMKDVWFRDPDIPQEKMDLFNQAFAEMTIVIDHRWAKAIWNPNKKKPKLTVTDAGPEKGDPGT